MNATAPVPYQLHEQASLAPHNTLRVDVCAAQLAHLYDATALPALLDKLATPPLVLGEGSNVLFRDDHPGSVLIMANQGVDIAAGETATRVTVAAGERWDDFVRWSLGQGFAGLENLIAIPGHVGGAPMQNIGAYGVEVAEFVESVEAWDTQSACPVSFDNVQCEFAYRDSRFKREPDRYIITAVRFQLPHERELTLDYAGLRQQLERMDVPRPTPYHVAEAVRTLRTRKLPDPAVIANAGSFFKNPIVDAAQAAELAKAHDELTQWPLADGRVKLSAAWLIEACGYKSWREGDAGISNRHALVLVNHGDATGAQLWTLAQAVIDSVATRFGIHLDTEPRVIPAPVSTDS